MLTDSLSPQHIDLIGRFSRVLPTIESWIDDILTSYADQVTPLTDLDHDRLKDYYSQDRLQNTLVIGVNQCPMPPLTIMGLPELAGFENMVVDGITYRDRFFVKHGSMVEKLFFHELVHIIQWDQLSPPSFLLAYGIGLMLYSYAESPLEQIAYQYQARFERGEEIHDVEGKVRRHAQNFWDQQTAPILELAATKSST